MSYKLFFDEAGYTGADLINEEQPYFCLASVRYTDEELRKICQDIGINNGDKEIHFKKMHTNREGRTSLNKLFDHPLLNKDHIVTGIALKRYCIYAQIVDTIIEVYCYNMGINLYSNRANLLLANGLYSFAVLHTDQALVRKFEKSYINMMRTPKVETVADFYRNTDLLIINENTCNEFCELLSEIPQTITTIRDALVDNNPFYMDNTLSLFVSILDKWHEKTGMSEDVMFDESKPMAAYQNLIENLRDMDVSETRVGYDERKHIYPLPVGQIMLVKSDDYFGVQIADAIASAIVFILTNKNKKLKLYQEKLKTLPIFQETNISLTPSTSEHLLKTIDTADDIDPIDFLCDQLSKINNKNLVSLNNYHLETMKKHNLK